jgi:hypothetical protein
MAHAAPPTLSLYGRPGCHLCEETAAILDAHLEARAAAGRPTLPVVHRNIEDDPTWERRFLTTIPVLEAGDHRLELATSPARIRAFVDEVLG